MQASKQQAENPHNAANQSAKSAHSRSKTVYKSNWIRGLACAFSTYSILPLPGYRYRSGDMAYSIAAFPLVGFVLGLFSCLLLAICQWLDFSCWLFAALNFALQVVLTGGIHLDGFADTADGIFSRRDRDRMLEIMHDPRIGPMAVIALIVLSFVQVALIGDLAARSGNVWRLGFSLALVEGLTRTQSGLLILDLPAARQDGMGKTAADEQSPNSLALLVIAFFSFSLLLVAIWGWPALFLVLALPVASFGFSRYAMHKFSGMTGDMAGYYLCLLTCLCYLLLLLVV